MMVRFAGYPNRVKLRRPSTLRRSPDRPIDPSASPLNCRLGYRHPCRRSPLSTLRNVTNFSILPSESLHFLSGFYWCIARRTRGISPCVVDRHGGTMSPSSTLLLRHCTLHLLIVGGGFSIIHLSYPCVIMRFFSSTYTKSMDGWAV